MSKTLLVKNDKKKIINLNGNNNKDKSKEI